VCWNFKFQIGRRMSSRKRRHGDSDPSGGDTDDGNRNTSGEGVAGGTPNGGTIRPGYFANASRKYRGRKKAAVEEVKTENARLKTETERLRLELTNCRESPSDSHGAVLKEILSLLRKQNDWIEQMMDTTLLVDQSKNEQEPLTAVGHDSDEPVVGVAQSPLKQEGNPGENGVSEAPHA
jgi:hypothetical protein